MIMMTLIVVRITNGNIKSNNKCTITSTSTSNIGNDGNNSKTSIY